MGRSDPGFGGGRFRSANWRTAPVTQTRPVVQPSLVTTSIYTPPGFSESAISIPVPSGHAGDTLMAFISTDADITDAGIFNGAAIDTQYHVIDATNIVAVYRITRAGTETTADFTFLFSGNPALIVANIAGAAVTGAATFVADTTGPISVGPTPAYVALWKGSGFLDATGLATLIADATSNSGISAALFDVTGAGTVDDSFAVYGTTAIPKP